MLKPGCMLHNQGIVVRYLELPGNDQIDIVLTVSSVAKVPFMVAYCNRIGHELYCPQRFGDVVEALRFMSSRAFRHGVTAKDEGFGPGVPDMETRVARTF